jgi:hypothetical protein
MTMVLEVFGITWLMALMAVVVAVGVVDRAASWRRQAIPIVVVGRQVRDRRGDPRRSGGGRSGPAGRGDDPLTCGRAPDRTGAGGPGGPARIVPGPVKRPS